MRDVWQGRELRSSPCPQARRSEKRRAKRKTLMAANDVRAPPQDIGRLPGLSQCNTSRRGCWQADQGMNHWRAEMMGNYQVRFGRGPMEKGYSTQYLASGLPYFLGLKQSPALSESQLETALLDHLQEFLLELGKGFSFVARQQRITIEGDHFHVDLVFYNRLLRAFVLIDLKIGKLTHRDIGQMQMYVNYYTREVREEWEAPAIGILLCAEKNDAVVRYTLPEGERRIFASRYQLYLPSEEELAAELRRERELLALHGKIEGEPES